MHRYRLVIALLTAGLVAGCGGGADEPGTTTTAPRAALPKLATRPAADGEIVVRGDLSPTTHGPYALDGRYVVRFEQYAPEDPAHDFSADTPFTAALTRAEGDPRGAVKLFEDAARSGRRSVRISGRHYVDVEFGDYPYVIRITPRD